MRLTATNAVSPRLEIEDAETAPFNTAPVGEVMRFGMSRTGTSVRSSERTADGYWFGNRPELLKDVRGPG